jgi:capsid protein
MTLARRAGHEPLAIPPRTRAMGTFPYDAAGRGRRGIGWNPSQLGQNTLLYAHGLELLARNRDAVRNSSWAAAAVDSYVANAIGRGIRMVPQHPDEQVRELILKKWNRWIRESDVEYDPNNPASGQTDFYGQQMIIAREVMEAGEVFVRFRPRPRKEGLAVPLQLQLIEAEQLPLWRMSSQEMPDGQPRALRDRVPARWAARCVPLLARASGRNDVLSARGDVRRACASDRRAARVQADSRRPVPRPAVADIGAGEALRTGAVHRRRDRPQEGRGDDHRVHQAGQPGQSDHPAGSAAERSEAD